MVCCCLLLVKQTSPTGENVRTPPPKESCICHAVFERHQVVQQLNRDGASMYEPWKALASSPVARGPRVTQISVLPTHAWEVA